MLVCKLILLVCNEYGQQFKKISKDLVKEDFVNEEDFSGGKIIREAIALLYYICCFSSSSVEELSGSLFLESSLLPIANQGLYLENSVVLSLT